MPGSVEPIHARNQEAEALTVARRAKALLRDGEGNPRTVAILTRTNGQLLELQSSLIRAETPYAISVDNDVRVAWELARRMLVAHPVLKKRGVPDAETRATVAECFGRARRLPTNQVGTLKRLATVDETAFPGPELLQVLPDRMRPAFESGLKTFKRAKTLDEQLTVLEDMLAAVPSSVMNGGRKTNQPSRLSGMIALAEEHDGKRKVFLAEVERLISVQREALRRDATPKVTLSTCHGAKGREWQVVFVPFCNEGIFPDARSEEGEYLEAERKLFYVSMTRASEHLVVSWADFRPDTGRRQAPSPFVIEAGLAVAPKTTARKPDPAPRGNHNANRSPAPRKTTGATESAAPWWGRGASRKGAASNGRNTTPRPARLITLFSTRSRVVIDGLDAKKVADLSARILDDEERYGLAIGEMLIRYQAHDPEATLPLQLDLALRGVPFAIEDAHRFTEADTFMAMRESWTSGVERVTGSLGADTISAMERVLGQATDSTDHRRWHAALERIADEEPGTDPGGIQFTTG
jgi:hypothetical protein